jgi:L-lactate dehydrogenase
MLQNEIKKITIIGAGFVGSTSAFALMARGIAKEIVIIDTNEKKAEGEAMDMMHGVPFVKPVSVYSGDYSQCEGSGIIVITAGANQKVGETRMDLVNKNVAIFKNIIGEILKYNKDAILLVVTNPVDILTYVTYKLSGFPRERVIGSGTVLDTARFRSLIASHVGVDARNVHGYILGEHGDTEVAVMSLTNIAGIPVEEYCRSCVENCTGKHLEFIVDEVKNAAYQIIERKGATYYAVALGVARIVEAMIRDENSILTVSTFIDGENGFNDVCFSLPTVIGMDGRKKLLNLNLTSEEYDKLTKSQNALKDVLQKIDI